MTNVVGETYTDKLFSNADYLKKDAFGFLLSKLALEKGLKTHSSSGHNLSELNPPVQIGTFTGRSNWAELTVRPTDTRVMAAFKSVFELTVLQDSSVKFHDFGQLVQTALHKDMRYTQVHEQMVSQQGETIGLPVVRLLTVSEPAMVLYRQSADHELTAISPNTSGWDGAKEYMESLKPMQFDQAVDLDIDALDAVGLLVTG